MATPAPNSSANPNSGNAWQGGSYTLGGKDGDNKPIPSEKVNNPFGSAGGAAPSQGANVHTVHAAPGQPKQVISTEVSTLRKVLSCMPFIGTFMQVYNGAEINARIAMLNPGDKAGLKAALEQKMRFNKYASISHVATIAFFIAMGVLFGFGGGLIVGMLLASIALGFTLYSNSLVKDHLKTVTS
jgi:hypothetical protein